MKNRYKYLAKNTLAFFISSFTSKILIFMLLPLYTTVLTTSEYAISDLMSTCTNLLYMVSTLMISESILRFTIDKRYNKSEILNTGLLIIIINAMLIGCGFLFVSKTNYIQIFDGYWLEFFLLYLFYSMNELLVGFIRGIEKINLVAITGVIGTIITVTCNIILLVVFEYGIKGYIASMVITNALTSCVYIIFGKVYKYINIKPLNMRLIIEMLQYSSPIVITQIAWWINSAADRYMVTWLLGASETGLLSVAHRLPSMLTVFTGIFMKAWKLSAIKEYDSTYSQEFFSKMLNLYNSLLIVVGAVVIIFIRPISSLIFKGEFATAWYLVPSFILAFVINGVSAFLGTFYIANKNTKPLMYSTLIGALANIVINYILIKEIGTIGAGIATVVSYFIISSIRTIHVKKQIKLHIEFKRIISSYLLLVLLTATVSIGIKGIVFISTLILTVLIWLNKKYVFGLIGLIMTAVSKLRRNKHAK